MTGHPTRARRGLDRFELAVLAGFAALSSWMVGGDLLEAARHHLVWTGTDGFYTGDQLQYLAWIRSAAEHGLTGDLYVLRATPADYAQPAILVSAGLVRLGVPAWLALLLWKPVAVVALVLAVRALVEHTVGGLLARRLALVLCLFATSLTSVFGSLGVLGDIVSLWQSWGYPFGLIGVALVVLALPRYAAAREAGALTAVPGLLGALAGWLHPWQGELMVLVIGLAELVRLPRRDGSARLAALTLGLLALPIAYYFALGHLDPVWALGQAHARHRFSATTALIAAGPLLVVALLGYRGRPRDFTELCVRTWPFAALAIWLFSLTALGATPQHAVNGLPIALGVLAVLGVTRSRRLVRLPHGRALAVAATALLTAPGTVFMLAEADRYVAPHGNANLISPQASRALTWLAHARARGGVLTDFRLGSAVPGLTGRRTYVGDCLWSLPDCPGRERAANALLAGRMPRAQARALLARTRPRFVLGGCDAPPDGAGPALAGQVQAVHRFGCATVWQLRPGASG